MIFRVEYNRASDPIGNPRRTVWITGTDRDEDASEAFFAQHPDAALVKAISLKGDHIAVEGKP